MMGERVKDSLYINTLAHTKGSEVLGRVNVDGLFQGDKEFLVTQKQLVTSVKKIQAFQDVISDFSKLQAVKAVRDDGQVELYYKSNNKWKQAYIQFEKDYKRALDLEYLINHKLHKMAHKKGALQSLKPSYGVSGTGTEKTVKHRKLHKLSKIGNAGYDLSGPVAQGGIDSWDGVMSLWGVFQPAMDHWFDDVFDVTGFSWQIFINAKNLPVISQMHSLVKASHIGMFNKHMRGKDWSLKNAILNVLPDQGGITLNKESRADAVYGYGKSVVSVAGYGLGLVAKVFAWTSVGGTATVTTFGIGGYVLLTGVAASGVFYNFAEIYKVHRFKKKAMKQLKGPGTSAEKLDKTINHLLDRVWLTSGKNGDLEKIEKEVAKNIHKPPLFERILHIEMTAQERHDEKIGKIQDNRKKNYLRRAGKRSYTPLQEEANKRLVALSNNEEYVSSLSVDEKQKIIKRMISECKGQQKEMSVKALASALVSAAYIAIIASIASGQIYLLSIAFALFLVVALLGVGLANRAILKYIKTKEISTYKHTVLNCLGVKGGSPV